MNEQVETPTPEKTNQVEQTVSTVVDVKGYCQMLRGSPPEQFPSMDQAANQITAIFNKSYAYLIVGKDLMVLHETRDDKGRECALFIRLGSFKKWGANLNAYCIDDGKIKTVNACMAWEKHPNRRTYQGLTFAPNAAVRADYFNLWRGWGVGPELVEGYPLIQRFLTHLFDNVCDGNEDSYNYLLTWIAHMFQHPEQKPEVAVVLRSEERGTGKSKVPEVLRVLVGTHYVKASNTKHLLGNFNQHLATAMFIHVEESFWSGNKGDAEMLRDIITGREMPIEGKGVDVVMVPSYHRIMMVTNNDWAVPAARDERRFFVLDVAAHKKQNRKYFKALSDDLENGGYGQLLDFFLNLKIERDVNQAPRTKGLENQIIESLQPHEAWWLSSLVGGAFASSHTERIDEFIGRRITNASLFESYKQYLNDHSLGRPLAERALGRKITAFVGGKLARGRPQKHDGQNAYDYPPLEDLRKKFIGYLDVSEFDWNQ